MNEALLLVDMYKKERIDTPRSKLCERPVLPTATIPFQHVCSERKSYWVRCLFFEVWFCVQHCCSADGSDYDDYIIACCVCCGHGCCGSARKQTCERSAIWAKLQQITGGKYRQEFERLSTVMLPKTHHRIQEHDTVGTGHYDNIRHVKTLQNTKKPNIT